MIKNKTNCLYASVLHKAFKHLRKSPQKAEQMELVHTTIAAPEFAFYFLGILTAGARALRLITVMNMNVVNAESEYLSHKEGKREQGDA